MLGNIISKNKIKNSTVEQSISVNGDNVSFINDKLYVNEKEYKIENKNSNIKIKGKVSTINTDRSITIDGNVEGDINVMNSINVTGNIKGDIDAGGSVNITGRHKGNITAGGAVNIRNN